MIRTSATVTLAAALSLMACREDIDLIEPGTPELPPTVELVTASLAGVVTGEDGGALADARVGVVDDGREVFSTFSNAEGRWIAKDVALAAAAGGAEIRVTHEGSLPAVYRTPLRQDVTMYTAAQLFGLDVSVFVGPDEDVRASRGQLTFDLTDAGYRRNGTAVTEEVAIGLRAVAPSRDNIAAVPQPFALASGETFVPAELYYLRAHDRDGIALDLDSSATLELATISGEALYGYDLATGAWTEFLEVDGAYAVDQFGYFATGVTAAASQVSGRLVGVDSVGVGGASVIGLAADLGDDGYFESALTDGDGAFALTVPDDTDIAVIILAGRCAPDPVALPGASVDRDLGDVTVGTPRTMVVTGQLVGCDGEPAGGLAQVFYGANEFVEANPDGSFRIEAAKCDDADLRLTTIFTDATTSVMDVPDDGSGVTELVEIEKCGSGTGELFGSIIISNDDPVIGNDTILDNRVTVNENDGAYTFLLGQGDERPQYALEVTPDLADSTNLYRLSVTNLDARLGIVAEGYPDGVAVSQLDDDGTYVSFATQIEEATIREEGVNGERYARVEIEVVAAY